MILGVVFCLFVYFWFFFVCLFFVFQGYLCRTSLAFIFCFWHFVSRNFSLGGFFFLPCISLSRWSLSPSFSSSSSAAAAASVRRVFCSRSNAHSTRVINYFAFLLMNIYSQKRTIHNISMHFFFFSLRYSVKQRSAAFGWSVFACCYRL